MDSSHIYQQIAESLRQQILDETLKLGDRLPSLRSMTVLWGCTPGTVQHAYSELARQGLVVSRRGQGTHVVGLVTAREGAPLRRAGLIHRAESFLLETISAGHTPDEIEQAVRIALDRWRTLQNQPSPLRSEVLVFNGSHDPAMAWAAGQFHTDFPSFSLDLHFSGSLGGLIALAEGKCDLAGSHLWDQETQTYNHAYIRRILPGKRIVLIHFAYRRLGLILPAGNPLNITSLPDLVRQEVRFVNRQPGSGTRVRLDNALHNLHMHPSQIHGYEQEKLSHSDVAREVAEGRANVGFGLETSALAYGLDFILLTREIYHLVLPESSLERPIIQTLLTWLNTDRVKAGITALRGYDTSHTGQTEILET